MANNANIKDKLRQKIQDMHDYISSSYYVNSPNLNAGRPYNDVALMSIMTGLLKKNQLTSGNYGLGKTSTSEAVSSLIYRLPIEFVHQGMIQGHPFLTEEKIIGRLDFSKLKDHEKVIFSTFAQTPSSKIIDEINRIPEGTQTNLLGCVETGDFIYLNQNIVQPKMPFFATANYKDGGNTDLIPPIIDRFDISVEVQPPVFLGSYIRGDIHLEDLTEKQRASLKSLDEGYTASMPKNNSEALELRKKYFSNLETILESPHIKSRQALLSDRAMGQEMSSIINDEKFDYGQKMEKIQGLSGKFEERLNGLALTNDDMYLVGRICETQKMTKDASIYLDSLFDSLNSYLKTNESNHAKEMLTGKVNNNLSVRPQNRAAPEYAKLLSFMKGEDAVSTETMMQVLPYVLNHRTEFSDKFKVDVDDHNLNSMQMQRAREFVKQYTNDKEQGYLKNKHMLHDLYKSVQQGTLGDFAKKYASSNSPLVKKAQSMSRTSKED